MYYGMHAYWWFFWLVLWLCYFSWFMPMRRTTYRLLQTPLQLLQTRYAAGELDSAEYEERREKLVRDQRTK